MGSRSNLVKGWIAGADIVLRHKNIYILGWKEGRRRAGDAEQLYKVKFVGEDGSVLYEYVAGGILLSNPQYIEIDETLDSPFEAIRFRIEYLGNARDERQIVKIYDKWVKCKDIEQVKLKDGNRYIVVVENNNGIFIKCIKEGREYWRTPFDTEYGRVVRMGDSFLLRHFDRDRYIMLAEVEEDLNGHKEVILKKRARGPIETGIRKFRRAELISNKDK